ncbi:carboxypeptidase-like regulatory domain-containing protein [Bremerella alba]|uniref:Carboxypeptidase regulatory-like domain-containing protein n=1 Tax=Bremerella alba TaxID=980252 RepID=A0A7V9A6R5_9BACT|nr:carboxypeptidase-like regulatory domain-containing protein [Bremerella alba]MBA2114650.1 hypothetical protein [Bremerella alba]
MSISWCRCAPLVLCVSLFLIAGCTSQETGESLGATVTGTILYKGSPVDGAMVTFRPTGEGGHGAFAQTDEEGKYKLSTSVAGTTGVQPGDYVVTVTKTEAAQSNVASEDDPNYNPNASGRAPAAKNVLPKKYAAAKTSGLEFTVNQGPNNLPIELAD